jgi:hypothetical protein
MHLLGDDLEGKCDRMTIESSNFYLCRALLSYLRILLYLTLRPKAANFRLLGLSSISFSYNGTGARLTILWNRPDWLALMHRIMYTGHQLGFTTLVQRRSATTQEEDDLVPVGTVESRRRRLQKAANNKPTSPPSPLTERERDSERVG